MVTTFQRAMTSIAPIAPTLVPAPVMRNARVDSHRSQLEYGSFARSIPRPAGTTETDVTATYRGGVLQTGVPVTAQTEPEPVQGIPITRSRPLRAAPGPAPAALQRTTSPRRQEEK